MHPSRKWLKAIVDVEAPLASDWLETGGPAEWLVFAGKRPSLKLDDLIVYWTPADRKLVGVVSVFMPPTNDNADPDWPWRCRIQPRLLIADVERAPSIECMNGPTGRDFKAMRRLAHTALSDEEYGRAVAAIRAGLDSDRDVDRPGAFDDRVWTEPSPVLSVHES